MRCVPRSSGATSTRMTNQSGKPTWPAAPWSQIGNFAIHVPELGLSLYRWMRVVAAGRQDFRVQLKDHAELGAVDAGVADEGNQCHILLE